MVEFVDQMVQEDEMGTIGVDTVTLQKKRGRAGTTAAVKRQFAHRRIVKGIKATTIKRALDKNVVTTEELYRFIPKTTLDRKMREGRDLTAEEADRIARFLRLKSYAEEVFEDRDITKTWLTEDNPALGGEAPINMVVTDEGTRRVETVLRRIDYGDYS